MKHFSKTMILFYSQFRHDKYKLSFGTQNILSENQLILFKTKSIYPHLNYQIFSKKKGEFMIRQLHNLPSAGLPS